MTLEAVRNKNDYIVVYCDKELKDMLGAVTGKKPKSVPKYLVSKITRECIKLGLPLLAKQNLHIAERLKKFNQNK